MPLRIDSFRAAYRIAHAAGWDEANRRMARERRTSWNEADWDEAAATFRRVLGGSVTAIFLPLCNILDFRQRHE